MTRSGRRLAGLLGCWIALSAIGAPDARAQEQTVVAPTAFDVNGGSVTSPALESGRTYRLVAGGIFQEVGPNVTFDHDAAYCYGDNATIPICRDDPSLSQTGLWVGYENASAPFYELAGAAPPYAPSHQYEITFVAAQSAPLEFRANTPELNRDYVGQLGVALYLQQESRCRRMAIAEPAQSDCLSPDAYSSKPALGEESSYRSPADGKAVKAKGPVIPKDAGGLRIDFESAKGLEIYAVDPTENAAEAAGILCSLAGAAVWTSTVDKTRFAPQEPGFRCVGAVIAVLNRCQQLKRKRGGPGLCGGPTRPSARASAAGGCFWATIAAGRSSFKARCKATATGSALILSDRRGGPSLREALGKRPGLIIGGGDDGVPRARTDRVGVTWTAIP